MYQKTLFLLACLVFLLAGSVQAQIENTTQMTTHTSIQDAINNANPGDNIYVPDGTYTITSTLLVNEEVTIEGESEAGVILDASGLMPLTARVIETNADNITLRNMTIKPITDPDPSLVSNDNIGYTIKAGSNSAPNIDLNLTLENITIDGAAERTPFDIHGVDGVDLINLTANNTTRGNGINITGCTDVNIDGFTGTNNAWGSIAIYASRDVPSTGRGSENVTIVGSSLSIGMDGSIYSQDDIDGSNDLFNTNISVTGWDYNVFNDDFRPDGPEFTYFLETEALATMSAEDLQTNPLVTPNTASAIQQISTGEWFVTNTNLSIQAAIDEAEAGDVVNVDADTYVITEQIVVDKDLTISGDGKTTTTIKAGANFVGSNASDPGMILVNTGVELDFSGFTIDGDYPNYEVRMGLITYGSNGSIHDCGFENIRDLPYDGRGVVVYGTDVTVEDNMLSNIGRIGIMFRKAYSGPQVGSGIARGNMYTGKGEGDFLDYGIEVGAAASATLEDNTISDCKGIASTDGSVSAGILATDFFATGTVVTISGNTITNNSNGIAVGFSDNDLTEANINSNDLSNNTEFGLFTTENVVVDATCNWWGDADGPTAGYVGGDAPVDPWLVTSDLNNPDCTGTDCGVESPSNLQATTTGTTADLSWDPVPGAVNYEVWNSNALGTYQTVAGTTITISGLQPKTEYDWAVRAVCATGDKTPWTFSSFVTKEILCTATPPTGLTSTDITTNSATLNWDPVPGAIEYHVWNSNELGTFVTVSGTNLMITGLQPGTEYTWGVRAVCELGVTSNWVFSNFSTLQEDCALSPPTGLVEIPGVNSVDLSWDPVPGAASYQVWCNAFPGTLTPVNTPSTSFSGLNPSTTYTWGVRVVCPGGDLGEWSFGSFTTLEEACLGTPPTNLTETNITSNSADLNWDPVAGATGYHIWNSNELGTYDVVGAGTTTFNLSGLSASTEYNWAVRAVCVGGVTNWTFDSFTTSSNFGDPNTSALKGNDSINDQATDNRSRVASTVLRTQVKVFPNPVSGNYVNVQLDDARVMERISLYSLTGELIQWVDGLADQQYELNFNTTLPAGTYILRIEGADFAVAKRIVVQ
jgi:hypothetical protein